MELLKLDERPAEFPWQDITIFYRKTLTVGDKFAIDTAGTVMNGDKIQFQPWDFYVKMIQLFVTGWKGVMENGKEIAYSFDTFMNRIPSDTTNDLVMKLGYHLAKEIGFLKEKSEEETKNV